MMRRLAVLAPAAALAVALASIDLPIVTLGPGPAREVLPLIEVDGARTYDPSGRLLLTTVGWARATALEAVVGWADGDTEVVPEDRVIPEDETDQEFEQEGLDSMRASQIAATVVALRRVTDYPDRRGTGGLVQQVLTDSPADGVLRPGDVILSVNGRRLSEPDMLGDEVQEAGTRGELRLRVDRGGERRTATLTPSRISGVDRPVIGVVVVANFPFDVRIRSGGVGGPSAGLMWALALMELLGPGDLVSGRAVAGTGEIDLEGGVHPVGGVRHKVVAAAQEGAELFLVPRENLAEARVAGADIEVVAVGSVDDAIARLGSP